MSDQPTFSEHCPQWDETKERFDAWWSAKSLGRPMIWLRGRRPTGAFGRGAAPVVADRGQEPPDPITLHTDPVYADRRMRRQLGEFVYLAEAYPETTINLGAGSLALYLGSEPEFRPDTIWFTEALETLEGVNLEIDDDNHWWRVHLELIRRLVELSGGDYLVSIPDLVENVDILSALRGPQAFCIDLVDSPEAVKERNVEVLHAYYKAYDEFHRLVGDAAGNCSFTAFRVWGRGRTAKVQCDFNAMIGPGQFEEFVLPTLAEQCRWLDNALFHLDGVDAIRHVDALMGIDELHALQWTAGAGKPDGGDAVWFDLYDTVHDAGKALHITVAGAAPEQIWAKCDAIVKRYGSDGIYLLLPDMPEKDARAFLARADEQWK